MATDGYKTVKIVDAEGSLIPSVFLNEAGIARQNKVVITVADGVVVVRRLDDLIETYTPQRQAEFLLSNAIDADDYESAVQEVRKLGIDPNSVPHVRPAGVP